MVEASTSQNCIQSILNEEEDILTHLFEPEHLHKASLPEMLEYMIESMQPEVDLITKNLELCVSQEHETKLEVLKMIEAIQLFKTHFEFTLAVLPNKSEDEVLAIKEGFPSIKEHYEKLKTSEDFAVVPVKSSVALAYKKVLPLLRRVVRETFKQNYDGDVELVASEAHIARIQIATHRFTICSKHYPTVAALSKDDVFFYEKSSEVWEDLRKNAVFKKLTTSQEIQSSYKMFYLALYIGFAVLNNRRKKKPNSALEKYLTFFRDTFYYGVDQDRMETDAQHYLINPPLEGTFQIWNLPDTFIVSTAVSVRLPFIGHDQLIYVPRRFPKITKEDILRQYQDGTINKITPQDMQALQMPDQLQEERAIIDELMIQDGNKVGVRIMASEPLNLKEAETSMIEGIFQKAVNVVKGSRSCGDEAIVIHVHGGGFVSLSSASHRSYLLKWAKNLRLVLFSIDYRLAPETKYPETLDDVWQAYLWIMNYAEETLGIKTKKVILIGDSAGGNLIFALTLRLIKYGMKVPDGLVLVYPSLSMDMNGFSPSYLLSIDDYLLPYSLLHLVIKAYIGDDFDPTKDPFISPLVASDELLEKLPPIRMVSGSKDPLHDENWKLLARLKKLNKEAKFVIHESLSHAYLNNMNLKNYDLYCDESCDLIRELLEWKA